MRIGQYEFGIYLDRVVDIVLLAPLVLYSLWSMTTYLHTLNLPHGELWDCLGAFAYGSKFGQDVKCGVALFSPWVFVFSLWFTNYIFYFWPVKRRRSHV